jgi:N-formylglutamate amidohydrolase
MVIHVPHASLYVPSSVRDQFLVDTSAIKAEARESADLWTDIIAHEVWPTATIVTANVSRIVVDVERYSDDTLEEMSQVGRGVVYTHSHDGMKIRWASKAIKDKLITKYYTPHWNNLRKASKGKTLIDLHSYPAKPWAVEPHKGNRPQIDIGTNVKLFPTPWVRKLTEFFQSNGVTVAINRPYVGVIDCGAQSAIMLEIRRDLLATGPESKIFKEMTNLLKRMPTAW